MTREPEESPRSGFATSIAWIMIVMAGFGTAIGAVQVVLVGVIYSHESLREAITKTLSDAGAPEWVGLLFDHLLSFSVATAAVSAAVLVVSIAFLRRRAWSRVPFLAILALSAVAHVVVPLAMFPAVDGLVASVPRGAVAGLDAKGFLHSVLVVNLVASVAMAGLVAWITVRLASDAIRREFESSA